MSSQKRVVIVGAGPGGLATGMLLAKAGMDVTILERMDRVGGRTSAIESDGFRFDTGPTFFLYPQILQDIFSAAGLDLSREVPMRRVDPQYRLIFEGHGDLIATGDVPRMQAAMARLSAPDAENLPRFLSENRTKLDVFAPCLQSPFSSWRDILTRRMLKLLPMLRPWNSLDRELQRYFSDPRIRLAFSFQAKYLGMSPFRCPGLFSILSFLEYEYGVFHPLGGCARVSERMGELLEASGVHIKLSEPVEELLFRGATVNAVRTHQATYPADAVVINADFAHAIPRLVPDALRRRWSNHRIEKARYSCSTFMMYLGIEGTCPELLHHNIYLAENYRKNLADIEQHHILSENPSFYVQNACVTDPSLAPAGCSTLYVLAPVSHQHANIDWKSAREPFRKTMIQQLQHLGLNDIESRIRFQRVVTPEDWQNRMAIYRGATFNLAHDFRQMLHFRPHNRFEETGGIYLVGGGTHPGSGLPVIFESSRISSRLLLEDMGMKDQWDQLASAMTMTQCNMGAAEKTELDAHWVAT
jgi:phytoene desaturase